MRISYFCTMKHDQIQHLFLFSNSHISPSQHQVLWFYFIFLYYTKSKWCCPYFYGCAAIHWSMVNLPVATHCKKKKIKKEPPFFSIHQ